MNGFLLLSDDAFPQANQMAGKVRAECFARLYAEIALLSSIFCLWGIKFFSNFPMGCENFLGNLAGV